MDMRRLSVLTAATIGATVVVFGGVAQAAPADQSPIGGNGAHTHHVHLGNGTCLDIDRVRFEPTVRGLHRGANEGAPEHRTCAAHAH